MKWNIGQRVERLVDVFDESSRMMHGTIVRRYARYGTRFGDYPELYDVLWDGEMKPSAGYLPHGIHPELTRRES